MIRYDTGLSGIIFLLVVIALFCPAVHAGDWLGDVRLTYSDPDNDDISGRGNLITDSEDNVYIAWQIIPSGLLNDIAVMYWSRRTGLWSPAPGAMPYIAPYCYGSDTNHFAQRPSICLTSDGLIHVVGVDLRDTTPTDPYDSAPIINTPSYRFFDPVRKVWSSCDFITYSNGAASLPHIVNDKYDNLHVVWYDDRSGHREIYHQRKDGVTGSWDSSDGIVSALDLLEDREPAACIDNEGNLHVIWTQNGDTDSRVFYRLWAYVSGNWLPIEEVTDSAVNIADKTSLIIDAHNNVHVVWIDSKDGNQEVYHRIKSGGTWQPSVRVTNNGKKDQAPYVTADTVGDVYMVYVEGETIDKYDLFFRKWSGVTGTWFEPEIVVLRTVPRTTLGPKVAADSKGNVHLVWTDNRNDGVHEMYYKKYSVAVPDPEINIDKSTYLGLGDQIEITVIDTSQNEDIVSRDELEVMVLSDTDPDGIKVTLQETGLNTAVFSTSSLGNPVRFSLFSSDETVPQIQVWNGDMITVRYFDDSPITYRYAYANWYETTVPTPTPGTIVPATGHVGVVLLLFVALIPWIRYCRLNRSCR